MLRRCPAGAARQHDNAYCFLIRGSELYSRNSGATAVLMDTPFTENMSGKEIAILATSASSNRSLKSRRQA
jgi:hypothetical protein